MSKLFSFLTAALPEAVGSLAGSRSGGFRTAIRLKALIRSQQEALRELMSAVDRIVVPSRWVQEVLVKNKVDPHKICLNRQGVSTEGRASPLASSGDLRVAFFGRLDRAKGPDLLVRAVRAMPEAKIQLHLYGIVQGDEAQSYGDALRSLMAGDSRIELRSSIPHERIMSVISNYDVVAVPSQLMETGPLVVLEAYAAGIPVIGSRLGGIAELVDDEINGLLVEPTHGDAWVRALARLYGDRELLERLRKGVRPPRTMRQASEDAAKLYRDIMAVQFKEPILPASA